MSTVFLLGFSTTGKSMILREFIDKHPQELRAIDSDAEISRCDGGHIYNVFTRFVDGQHRKQAIDVIERREEEFLHSVSENGTPTLIAGGPFLPIRGDSWKQFVDRIRPVFIYLHKSPEEVTEGLFLRRRKHLQNQSLASHPSFGSWDEGVTTRFSNGTWQELDRDTALENVKKHMEGITPIYARLAKHTFTWQERQTAAGSERIHKTICDELDLL